MYVFTVLMFTPTCKLQPLLPFSICISWLSINANGRDFFYPTLALDAITIYLAKQSHRAMRFRIRLIEFRGQLNSHYDHLNCVFSAQSIWIRLYRINEHLRSTMFSMNLTWSFPIAKWIFVKWSRKFHRLFIIKTRDARNKRKMSLKYAWN